VAMCDGGQTTGKRPALDAPPHEGQSPESTDQDLDARPLTDGCPDVDDDGRRLQENLDRRVADQQLVDQMALSNFTGKLYDRFANELAGYGTEVLKAWMYSGVIFTLTDERGRGLNPTELELEELHRDPDIRAELANMTVGMAFPRFREQALVAGGWRFDGGASLATYFTGACLDVFPNEFRKYRVARAKWVRDQPCGDEDIINIRDIVTDPAVIAVRKVTIRERLKRESPRTQAAALLDSYGFSYEEIRELLRDQYGDMSVRVIEGVLHRWRKRNSHADPKGSGQP
jgi:hypothetical protein